MLLSLQMNYPDAESSEYQSDFNFLLFGPDPVPIPKALGTGSGN